MIYERTEKINEIIETINRRICDINTLYRSGPDLYFYRKTMQLRSNCKEIKEFLAVDYNIEILYATLVSWDMNSRGAKMKYFTGFKENIHKCIPYFQKIQYFEENKTSDPRLLRAPIIEAYQNLDLMKTNSYLVSNSKLLHYLFPNICMPMDRNNTLNYFYGNTTESLNKYLEIFEFSQDLMKNQNNWTKYLDNTWNQSIPKMIDNAIILLRR